jgi:hypothetical protein
VAAIGQPAHQPGNVLGHVLGPKLRRLIGDDERVGRAVEPASLFLAGPHGGLADHRGALE